MNNFFQGIVAITNDIRLFIGDIIHNKLVLGFLGGIVVASLVVGFVLTKNPKNIPIMLRYSMTESFDRISRRDKNGTYQLAFSNFIKIYSQVRILFLIAFISFCTVITTVMLNTSDISK